ncbi:MAG: AI-2E family transporter [Patescibacteria group bacterium]|jgi:predicted PurR-regulated permease PerM|nr:AI-2E family transporter [Patescibacteria group bacterium]
MENEKKSQYFNISFLTIVKILVALLLFFVLYVVRDILAVLFISLILASALDPWVDWMQDRKIPRGVGIITIYLLLFGIVGSVILLVIPPITSQITELTSHYPQISEKLSSGFTLLKEYSLGANPLENILSSKNSFPGFAKAAENIITGAIDVFGGIFTFFLVIVVTFYMVVEEDAVKKVIWSIAPAKNQVYVMQLISRMQKKIGLWLRGQIILSLLIFTLTYIGLSILGVEYALVLAIIAGLTEFIPYLGPMIAAIPAMFLAFTQGGAIFMAFVGILYYIIQLVENNIIVPKLMQKVVGLNPIVTLAVLMIGFKLAGVIGMVLSIPVATAINVFIKDIIDKKAFKSE